jgi:hypothetical protein
MRISQNQEDYSVHNNAFGRPVRLLLTMPLKAPATVLALAAHAEPDSHFPKA